MSILKTVKIRKTSANYKGYEYFSHVANIDGYYKTEDKIYFCSIRDWCTEQWGPSIELELYHEIKLLSGFDIMTMTKYPLNSHWAWKTSFNDLKIYLCTETEAAWFKLKWTF